MIPESPGLKTDWFEEINSFSMKYSYNPCKPEQPVQSIKLQEKETKDLGIQEICLIQKICFHSIGREFQSLAAQGKKLLT